MLRQILEHEGYMVSDASSGEEGYPTENIILMSGCDLHGLDAEFKVAKALVAVTMKKPFQRKSILKAIKLIQQ